jgi:hypothetical protein
MPGIEEKFQRGFNQRPVKEEEKVEYKSPYTPNEVGKMDKYKLANNNWNTFITPKLHEGSKTEFKNPPTPKEQIAWVVNNLNRDANIVHNPTDDETKKVLNGFYTEVQYEGIKDGKAVVVSEYKLINPGNTINFENLSGVMDYSQMPLKPRFIKK